MASDFRDLLDDLKERNRATLNAMMPLVYAELKRLAAAYMQHERTDHTLQPTALVHEAYLRLVGQRSVDWSDRAHTLGIAARMMRRVLVDHAAGRNADKRLGKLSRAPLDEEASAYQPIEIDTIDLDRALNRLAELDARQAAIVELRFFGGLTIEEAAEALGIAPVTVQREWATARLWLLRYISEEPVAMNPER